MKKISYIILSFSCFLGFPQMESADKKINPTTLQWGDYYSINGNNKQAIQFYTLAKDFLSLKQKRAFAKALNNEGNPKQIISIIKPFLNSKDATALDLYAFASLFDSENEQYQKYFKKAEMMSLDMRFKNYSDSIVSTYRLQNLNLNTKESEFGVFFLAPNDQVLFYLGPQMKQPKKKLATSQVYNLYKSKIDIETLTVSDAKELDLEFNSIYQDGPISLDPVKGMIYLTRSSQILTKNKKIQLDLYKVPYETFSKTPPTPLSINLKGYSTLHPTVSKDGKRLYFSSDRPGGYGGMDLYFVSLEEDDTAKDIVNLGPEINTSSDEVFPFSYSNEILFYASNNNSSKKLDIKMAVNQVANRWENVSLGHPFNSEEDDFAFSIDANSQIGFLSSNRLGGKGSDDIYAFKFSPHLKGLKDEYTIPSKDTLIVGFNTVLKNDLNQMYAEDPLVSIVPLEVELSRNVSKGKLHLNKNGSFWYVPNTQPAEQDSFSYRVKSAFDSSKEIMVHLTPEKTFFNDDLKPIYYKHDQFNIEPQFKPQLDSLIIRLNNYPELKVEISSYADCRGSSQYNLKLSRKRKEKVLEYIRPQISNPDRIFGKEYGENQDSQKRNYEYAIVIASFKKLKNATQFLKNQPDISDRAVIATKDEYYRIHLGEFDYYTDATKALKKLNESGIEAWISKNECGVEIDQNQLARKTTFKIIN